MTHIGGKPYKYPEKWMTLAMAYKPHLYICGHSHLLRVERDQKKNWLFINPGAFSLHGFHKVRKIDTLDKTDEHLLHLYYQTHL